jgi:hypothetical protein
MVKIKNDYFNYYCLRYTPPELKALCRFKAQANACASGGCRKCKYRGMLTPY